jgi:hypothetical protein
MERLRVTPTPGHAGDLQKELIRALAAVWIDRELPTAHLSNGWTIKSLPKVRMTSLFEQFDSTN